MNKVNARLRKSIRAKIVANTSSASVNFKFPKQKIQDLALIADLNGEKKILKQWEIFITGERLIIEVLKIAVVFFLSTSLSYGEIAPDFNKLADAIFFAEGGTFAAKPFGILSVSCEGYGECRKVCLNTIRNNWKRFNDYGHKTHPDYLSFLASRYAPIGVSNDPKNLNQNWLKNVRYFYDRPRTI